MSAKLDPVSASWMIDERCHRFCRKAFAALMFYTIYANTSPVDDDGAVRAFWRCAILAIEATILQCSLYVLSHRVVGPSGSINVAFCLSPFNHNHNRISHFSSCNKLHDTMANNYSRTRWGGEWRNRLLRHGL